MKFRLLLLLSSLLFQWIKTTHLYEYFYDYTYIFEIKTNISNKM